MSIMTVTTRISYKYLKKKTKRDLWLMFLPNAKWNDVEKLSKDEIISLVNKELDKT